MALDFQQVREQVRKLGENSRQRQEQLINLKDLAFSLLEEYAREPEKIRQRVGMVVQQHDPYLRCATFAREPLNACFVKPPPPQQATVLAADGSQINPDRHAEVMYCLINVGAIQLKQNSSEPAETTVHTQLFYDEKLYTETGTITEATLALMRDQSERAILAELALQSQPPVISFTDGPMELWGAKDSGEGASEFQQYLAAYLQALKQLHDLNVATAGYVDKPAANLVVRLIEVLMTPEAELTEIRKRSPLRGVNDRALFQKLLAPGERSAVFAMQSPSAKNYKDALALHFFYLNVGRAGKPSLARVEIPAWVAESTELLNNLHAILADQCRIMGARPYPYLLHRAHETALVSMKEKEQVTQMILQELRKRGAEVEDISNKQFAKNQPGRKRYG